MNSTEINSNALSIDVSKIDSVVLKRLIQEVRIEKEKDISAYNRVHNRHNRSISPIYKPQ
jgi:hypothetical protein